jgi:hypothetical protein
MRPAAVTLADGSRVSPADARFDPFWSRLNEAGITLVIHAADSGYTTHGYVSDGFSSDFNGGVFSPNIKHFNIERAAYDFLITLAYEKLFERFPGLRIASIENGAEYLPDLFRKLGQSRDRMRGYYDEDPAELFRRHVWINPCPAKDHARQYAFSEYPAAGVSLVLFWGARNPRAAVGPEVGVGADLSAVFCWPRPCSGRPSALPARPGRFRARAHRCAGDRPHWSSHRWSG